MARHTTPPLRPAVAVPFEAMPLYEYECRACDKRFDRLVSMTSSDEAECPRCGAHEARRLISVISGMTGRAEAPAPVCGQGACGACS